MKSIIVTGGIGNQMFLYALYLAMQAKGINVQLDISLYNYVKMHNGYELDRIFDCSSLLVNKQKLHILWLRVLLRFKPKHLLLSDDGIINMQIFNTYCKYIAGYWQSERYFEDCIAKVHQAFTFKNIDFINQQIAQEMHMCNSVSLHIRRGDYIGMKEYEGICTEEYYANAIAYIERQVKAPFYYVFSNDIEWTELFISKMGIPHLIIGHNTGVDSYKDMYLMTQCKYNIVANSSFSWWGAWLNSYNDKIVIAPKIWINTLNDKYSNIVPEEWIRI